MKGFPLLLAASCLMLLAGCATESDCWKPDFESKPWQKYDKQEATTTGGAATASEPSVSEPSVDESVPEEPAVPTTSGNR